jgi:hypothetical protein
MCEAENEAGVAAYLVGHGPYRSPRLIELQWMRIRRYRGLLGTKYEMRLNQLEAFVDVNLPRADRLTLLKMRAQLINVMKLIRA